MERLEQCIDTLTELVNTLVAALGQNVTSMAPAILLGVPLTNAEGEEEPPSQKGKDTTASEARIDTSVRWRRGRYRHQNTARVVRENCEPTLESYKTEHTRDSVFNRLKRPVADPNLDDNYDSEYERLAGSRESANLCAQPDARRAQREQQAENRPPVRVTPEE